MCGFTFVTHGELRLVDHPRQARRMPTFLTPACGLVRGRRGVGSLFPPRGRALHPHVKQFRHFCVRHILASICITYVSRQLVAPQSPVGLVLRRVTELVAEFSPSAYTTDTQLSRVQRIPQIPAENFQRLFAELSCLGGDAEQHFVSRFFLAHVPQQLRLP
jgi:hypothetical protein